MTPIFKTEQGKAAVHARYREILAHWPVASEEQQIPTREGETFVVASGPADAPAVLLLHGSGSTAAMWMGDVAAWAKDFRVYAIDMIGEPGLSAPSRPPLDSEAYALWLDDVMQGLGLERAAIVGLSLGGWLGLDYAVRRPGRVERLVLICPGGVGANVNILRWALPLLLLGRFGRRRLIDRIIGPAAAQAPADFQVFRDLMALIFQHFRPRMEPLPVVSDADLERLTMPVLAVLGGKDELVDSEGVRRRLQTHAPRAEVRWVPEAGHVILGQSDAILAFLGANPSPPRFANPRR